MELLVSILGSRLTFLTAPINNCRFAAFLVKHFSDIVEYSCNGFLEKNRDTVSKELVNVLRESDLEICRKLMAFDDENVPNQNASTSHLGGRVVISAAKSAVSILDYEFV